MRLIDADVLYEKFLKLERDALDECLKYDASDKRFGVWSIILSERTSYKHDVQDFPDIEIVQCRDCIHAFVFDEGGMVCNRLVNFDDDDNQMIVVPEFFCAAGRREE